MLLILYRIIFSKWFKYVLIGLILAILVISLASCNPNDSSSIPSEAAPIEF